MVAGAAILEVGMDSFIVGWLTAMVVVVVLFATIPELSQAIAMIILNRM